MSKIMTWYVWMVTYLRRNVTVVCGASYHLLGSWISWDLKIRFRLQVKSYISDWQFSEWRHFSKLCFPPKCHGLWHKVAFTWLNALLMDLVPELGNPLGPLALVILVWPHSSIEVRVASNHSILPSSHIRLVPCYGSVLLSLPFGKLNHNYCLHLVTLGFVTIITCKCFQVLN